MLVKPLIQTTWISHALLLQSPTRNVEFSVNRNKSALFAFQNSDAASPDHNPSGGRHAATSLNRLNQLDYSRYDVSDTEIVDTINANQLSEQLKGKRNMDDLAQTLLFNTDSNIEIIPLLTRFRLVRQASKCFAHIMRMQPDWGDENEIERRSFFVSLLNPTQIESFEALFRIIDKDGNGKIDIDDLQGLVNSTANGQSAHTICADEHTMISFEEFMG